MVCFKGLIHFLGGIEVKSEGAADMISKSLKDIVKTQKMKEYDIVQFYNVIALMAKYNLGKNKFWR